LENNEIGEEENNSNLNKLHACQKKKKIKLNKLDLNREIEITNEKS